MKFVKVLTFPKLVIATQMPGGVNQHLHLLEWGQLHVIVNLRYVKFGLRDPDFAHDEIFIMFEKQPPERLGFL
jgi:hypothetical protein